MNTQTDNEPKSFREQLEILKNRGMVIEDDQIALKYLQNVNYYKISGYTYFFRDTQSINIEKFKSNTSLSQIKFLRKLPLPPVYRSGRKWKYNALLFVFRYIKQTKSAASGLCFDG